VHAGIADGVVGDATLRGNRLAEQHGVSVADFDPDTPIVKPKPEAATNGGPPEASKPASDRKPAGDSPMPQAKHIKESSDVAGRGNSEAKE
jgi:NADH-quinone oxidoreductase subunit E